MAQRRTRIGKDLLMIVSVCAAQLHTIFASDYSWYNIGLSFALCRETGGIELRLFSAMFTLRYLLEADVTKKRMFSTVGAMTFITSEIWFRTLHSYHSRQSVTGTWSIMIQ